MQVYVIDNEPLLLEDLTDELKKVLPQAEIHGFWRPDEFLKAFYQRPGEMAFIDIEMPLMDGLTVAKRLQTIKENVNIIFVTSFEKYKGDAMDLYASAYIVKPVTQAKLTKALRHLRYPLSEGVANLQQEQERLVVKCFGEFAVYYKGQPLKFQHRKTQELFAYLIDRRGVPVTARQIICALWEDDKEHVAYYQNLRNDLLQTLQKLPLQVINTAYGCLSLNREAINCDFYNFLDTNDKREYLGEYMEQYAWAATTRANLDGVFLMEKTEQSK